MFKSKNITNNHQKNREKICLLCLKVDRKFKNSSVKKIPPKGKIENKINLLFKYNVTDNDDLPNGICNTCMRNLYSGKTIELPNFTPFNEVRVVRTRSNINSKCDCKICLMATGLLTMNVPEESTKTSDKESNEKVESQNVCVNCLSVIPDIPDSHNCNRSALFKNLRSISKINSKERDQLISFLIKEKCKEKGESTTDYATSLTQLSGRNMRITVNSKPNKDEQNHLISVEDMKMLQVSLNLSQNSTIGVAAMIRMATRKRKMIEPNLKKYLSAAIHTVDSFFEAKAFNFVYVKANNTSTIERNVVYCNNLNGFTKYVTQNREATYPHYKVGIDGGGGFLKVCLSIQSTDVVPPSSKSSRQSYKDGFASKPFRDSGVKKLFILAIAESTQENYENVKELWSSIDVDQLEGTISVDLKLANILCGIMSHSSSYPCTWCYAKSDELNLLGELRTIGNILSNYNNWQNSGGIKSSAKNFMNCVEPPIFVRDNETPILNIITPPELHLMIGVVNTIYNHMSAEYEEVVSTWTRYCHVEREVTRGGSGFNGNSCKILLEKLDNLRATCPIGCLKYVQTLDKFHLVVKSCFGGTLNAKFTDYITSFQESYLDLGISVTPKVHAVFFHVKDFCVDHQQPLGFYSEQAMESVHFDFKTVWQKYEVKSIHPDYPDRLFKAVCEFNGLHI